MTLPLDTDPILAAHYEDLNTGCVYHLDQDTSSPTYLTYILDYCPPAAGVGPPGPTGPPGPPGGSGILLGNYRWNTARGPSPATGRARLNANPVIGTPNLLLINEQEVAGDNRTAYLAQVAVGSTIWIDDGSGDLITAAVTAAPTDMGTYWQFPFTPTGIVEPADNASITISMAAKDVTAPEVPTGLVLTTGTILQTDGSLRVFVRGDWTPIPNAGGDFFDYEIDVVPANPYIPIQGGSLGWRAEARTGTLVLPVGGYLIGVSTYGADGGETKGLTQRVEIVAGQKLFVTNLLAAGSPAGLSSTYAIYVVPSTTGAETPLWYMDTNAAEVEITAVPGGVRTMKTASEAYSWTGEGLVHLSAVATYFVLPSVLGGTVQTARVRSVDASGNRSASSLAASVLSATDGIAPHAPTALSAAAGYQLVGLQWSRSDSADMDRYQVRYRAVGAPDWIGPLNVYANMTIISDLDQYITPPVPGGAAGVFAAYEFAVRAIDHSGNIEIAPGPPQTVGNVSDITLGWTSSVQVTMSAIPSSALAVEELFSNYAYLINVTADQITTGHLDVTPGPSDPNSIIMWNDAAQTIMVGYWSPSGWYIVDPANRTRAIRGKNGVLSFTSAAWFPGNPAGNGQVWQTPDASWTTAIGPDGISADLITLGGLPGGHNRLLNSGFELRPNSAPGSFTYDTAAEWDTVSPTGTLLTGPTNKNTAIATLQQLKYQYTDV